MNLSVIIPTFNRSQSVVKTLECLRRQVVPADLAWEILVVDNNSRDDTEVRVKSLVASFPIPLRYVLETEQGASHARNRGIKESRADILAFTDDDVRPDPHWVESLYATFEKHKCDGVAGKIELEWNCSRPKWLTDDLLGFLARLDYGPDELPLINEETSPFGPNMAFRRPVFEQIGGFNTALGPKGKSLTRGEEPELFQRFLHAGLRAVYQPNAIVHHVVDVRQVRKSFFRSVHFLSGRDVGRRNRGARGKELLGVPLYLIPQLSRSFGTFVHTAVTAGYRYSLRKEMTVWYFVGFILGCNERYRSSGPPHL
jgi:glucosyl-dolichyl phosphate glucuronosyltransferase